jgi:DNA-binding NarL/FixJ family response regulator
MKKILIADDHDIVRVGINSILADLPGVIVIGETRDGIETLDAVERLRPDILILDNQMPGMDGIEVARQLDRMKAACQIVMLTMSGAKAFVRGAFEAGVQAYILKGKVKTELLAALEAIEYGDIYLSPDLGDVDTVRWLLSENEPSTGTEEMLARLTLRERQVLIAVVRGLSNSEIATRLTIGVRTVETHRKNLMVKLGVESKDKLLMLAIARGLVELDDHGNIIGEGFDLIQISR